MRTLLAMGWVLATLIQAKVAYIVCFEATGLGGYGPFMMFVAPMLMCGLFLYTLARRDD